MGRNDADFAEIAAAFGAVEGGDASDGVPAFAAGGDVGEGGGAEALADRACDEHGGEGDEGEEDDWG